MTGQQKEHITAMRMQGISYSAIAQSLGLKKETVAAFCRKNGLNGVKAADSRVIPSQTDTCPVCGAVLMQIPGRKKRRFCSDKCRTLWWNSHLDMVNRKAYYSFVCGHCGKPFMAYGNSSRKYCSIPCAIAERSRAHA